MPLAETDLLTAEAFARLPQPEGRDELLRGRVLLRPYRTTGEGIASAAVGSLLWEAVPDETHGTVLATCGFVLARDPDTVLAPCASFVRAGRLPPAVMDEDRWPELAPDLAVETVGPWDDPAAFHDRVLTYLAAGTRLVWVIRPRDRTVEVWRPDRPTRLLAAADRLDGADVLPGLRAPVADLFERPLG